MILLTVEHRSWNNFSPPPLKLCPPLPPPFLLNNHLNFWTFLFHLENSQLTFIIGAGKSGKRIIVPILWTPPFHTSAGRLPNFDRPKYKRAARAAEPPTYPPSPIILRRLSTLPSFYYTHTHTQSQSQSCQTLKGQSMNEIQTSDIQTLAAL